MTDDRRGRCAGSSGRARRPGRGTRGGCEPRQRGRCSPGARRPPSPRAARGSSRSSAASRSRAPWSRAGPRGRRGRWRARGGCAGRRPLEQDQPRRRREEDHGDGGDGEPADGRIDRERAARHADEDHDRDRLVQERVLRHDPDAPQPPGEGRGHEGHEVGPLPGEDLQARPAPSGGRRGRAGRGRRVVPMRTAIQVRTALRVRGGPQEQGQQRRRDEAHEDGGKGLPDRGAECGRPGPGPGSPTRRERPSACLE